MKEFLPRPFPEDRVVSGKKIVKTLTASLFVIDEKPYGTVYDKRTIKKDPLDRKDNREILLKNAKIALDNRIFKLEELSPRSMSEEEMLKDHELLKSVNDAGSYSKILKFLVRVKKYFFGWFEKS